MAEQKLDAWIQVGWKCLLSVWHYRDDSILFWMLHVEKYNDVFYYIYYLMIYLYFYCILVFHLTPENNWHQYL